MPRAIEIYVDEKQKAVLINTNYGNREVRGASWEPELFRLGWDHPNDIERAMAQAVPGIQCELRLLLRDGPLRWRVLVGEHLCDPNVRFA